MFPLTKKQKKRIAHNFSRAASHYDQMNQLQRYTGKYLMDYLPSHATHILDAGCGTSTYANWLQRNYPHATLFGVDLAWGMLQMSKKNNSVLSLCAGDLEALPFKSNSFDLVFSNLSLQWCSFQSVLNEVKRILKPHGFFLFSTLSENSLHEIQSVWKQSDPWQHINRYPSVEQQQQMIHNTPFTVRFFKSECKTFYYNTVIDLLHELKFSGVSTVLQKHQGLMTLKKIKRFITSYETIKKPKGYPCSYHIIYAGLTHSL